jgi:hypothetical protein
MIAKSGARFSDKIMPKQEAQARGRDESAMSSR